MAKTLRRLFQVDTQTRWQRESLNIDITKISELTILSEPLQQFTEHLWQVMTL